MGNKSIRGIEKKEVEYPMTKPIIVTKCMHTHNIYILSRKQSICRGQKSLAGV